LWCRPTFTEAGIKTVFHHIHDGIEILWSAGRQNQWGSHGSGFASGARP
jgi:hypothetical protein